MKSIVSGTLAIALLAGVCFSAYAQGDKKAEPTSIKEVMKIAMKGGLAKKVIAGEADDAEKKQLLELLADLSDGKPKKGDEAEWTARTNAAVAAAAKMSLGRDAADALKAAVDCAACHKAHK
jgi:hypothetical protein